MGITWQEAEVADKIHCMTVLNFVFSLQYNPCTSMKILGRSPLKGIGEEGKEGARLDILPTGPRVPSYATGLKPVSQLQFNYDTTTIRRYHDAFDCDESDRNYNVHLIRLQYDYDTTTTKK